MYWVLKYIMWPHLRESFIMPVQLEVLEAAPWKSVRRRYSLHRRLSHTSRLPNFRITVEIMEQWTALWHCGFIFFSKRSMLLDAVAGWSTSLALQNSQLSTGSKWREIVYTGPPLMLLATLALKANSHCMQSCEGLVLANSDRFHLVVVGSPL